MTKRIQLLFLLTFLGFSFAYAQRVGDVCTNPAMANLCGGNTFTANTDSFKNDVSSWTYNGQTYYDYGVDVFYQINLPTSSYQPVSLYASLGGYFTNCPNCGGEIINFLWFENSPCSSNPVAVNSFDVNGQPNFHDSLLVTYPVSNSQSQYYLVIDFTYTNNYNYRYNLQLGFSNNQPPPALNCTTMPDPYKGTISLDQSDCYSSSNPYQLPLTALEDNPSDSNTLYPSYLNQDLKYLPINDDNKNGFILTIKTTTGVNSPYLGYSYTEEYKSFDKFPYTYSGGYFYGGASYTYDVALTVFFKNNGGASGIKGFRIQVPGSQTYYYYGAVPNANKGWYDTTGTWQVSFDNASYTYTWLFNGKNGRGDNTDNNGYSCKVYTFDGMFANLGNINAWYLPDDYGNDTTDCVYSTSNPPRTDCGMGGAGGYNNIGWIPLTGSLGGAGITGQQCGSDTSIDDGPVLSTCNPNGYFNNYSDISYDTSGCIIETDYYNDFETPDFVSDTLANSWYGISVYEGICNGQPYKMVLSGNGDYYSYYGATPSTVVYLDPNTGVYHPVDSSGNILYSEDYYNLTIPDDLPPYPGNFGTSSFTIPLSVPGTYTLIYTEEYFDEFYPYDTYYYPSYDCVPGNLILVNDSNPVISLSTTDTTICKGQSVDVSVYGSPNFTWIPDSAVGWFSSYNQTGGDLYPLSSTTYTVIGTDNYGCSSSPASVAVNVKYCPPTASFYYYYNCTSSCNYFVNESSYYYPTQGLWSFPGGTPSSIPYDINAQGVSACYSIPGVYKATLFVSNPAGQDSLTEYVQVGTCNVLAFATTSDTAICSGNCVTFHNYTPLVPDVQSFIWQFPGSTSSSSSGNNTQEQVCYANVGTYTASLIAIPYSGPTDTFKMTIHVTSCGPIKPVAAFTAPDTVCNANCVTLSNTSTGNPTGYAWSFNGGTPSSYNGQTPPNICYAKPGNYSIQLIVTNSNGGDTTSKTISVKNCIPAASFTAPDSVCNANCITISNSTSANATSWQWSFAGGIPSTYSGQTPPSACYANAGSYKIQLIVGNSSGNDTLAKTLFVKNCKPSASFTAPDSVCKTNCITATNSSSANATSWQWTFAGGTPSSYNGQTPPTVCYSSTGSFQIQLIASNSSGSDTTVKTISVKQCQSVASFTLVNDTICQTDCISITNTSSVNTSSWQWLFQGGTPSSYNGKNPSSVCYHTTGSFTIQLITIGSVGNDTAVKTITVNNCQPVASFTAKDTICQTDCIVITNTSRGNITSWKWLFPGGTPSSFNSKTPPNICYNSTGVYNTELIASNTYGSDTVYHTIDVNDCSPLGGIMGADSICAGDCTAFQNTSSSNSSNWSWLFVGGVPSSYIGQNPPAVCYQGGGNYVARLIVSNNYGVDTVFKNIKVNKFNAGDITANYNPACEGAPVIFTMSGSSGSIQWQSSDTTFNFNNIQNANSATYKIPSAATNIYVRVVSANGNCTDTSDTYKLIVYPPVTVNYTWKDSAADVVFHSQVSPPNNLVYAWNFGDDSTSNLINPVHLFKDYSSYYACLTVYTTANCSFTFCDHVSRDIGTAVNTSTQSEVNVYPDPFSDYLLIKAEGKRIRSVELYDVLGRLVINKTIGENYPVDNVLRLDATGLIDGMYFIRIKTDGNDYIQSVVRIHP